MASSIKAPWQPTPTSTFRKRDDLFAAELGLVDARVPQGGNLAEDVRELIHEPVSVRKSLPELAMKRRPPTEHVGELAGRQVSPPAELDGLAIRPHLPELLREVRSHLPQNGVAGDLHRLGEVGDDRPVVEGRIVPLVSQDLLRRGDEGACGRVQRQPRIVAEQVLPQIPLGRPHADRLGVHLGPESVVTNRRAILGVEVGVRLGLMNDERQVHHATVQRHRPVVVARIPQGLQLGDHHRRVIGHQAPEIEELVPEVALETGLRVVRRDVGTVRRADIVQPDLVHVADVQRAIVGQVEVAVPRLVAGQLGRDLLDLRHVLEILLPVGRTHLPPPYVGLGFRLPGIPAPGRLEQDADVRRHRIRGVCGVPDVHQVPLRDGGRHEPAIRRSRATTASRTAVRRQHVSLGTVLQHVPHRPVGVRERVIHRQRAILRQRLPLPFRDPARDPG